MKPLGICILAISTVSVPLALEGGQLPDDEPPHIASTRMAILKADAAALRRALDEGIDPNLRDRTGATLLMWAAGARAEQVVHVLLQAGADVNATDLNGSTPLMYAARARALSIASLLLKAGADVGARNADGETPLIVARRAAIRRWTFPLPFSDSYIVVALPEYFGRDDALVRLLTGEGRPSS
jgi:ankyrin repeat protein